MVSIPRAYRSSASREKTGSRCWSSRGRSAAVHSSLSRPASSAIVSQTSAVKVRNGLDRAIDFLVAVRERDEHALELARRDVHAAREQVPEERAVALGVAALRVVEVAHRLVVREQRRHRADTLHATVRRKARFESSRTGLEPAIDVLVAQPAEDRQPGRRGERIAGQRARLVDVAARSEAVHDVGATPERSQRQPAADDLAEDREIRRDAVQLLRAAASDAEAGDDLVEDQQRTGAVA